MSARVESNLLLIMHDVKLLTPHPAIEPALVLSQANSTGYPKVFHGKHNPSAKYLWTDQTSITGVLLTSPVACVRLPQLTSSALDPTARLWVIDCDDSA